MLGRGAYNTAASRKRHALRRSYRRSPARRAHANSLPPAPSDADVDAARPTSTRCRVEISQPGKSSALERGGRGRSEGVCRAQEHPGPPTRGWRARARTITGTDRSISSSETRLSTRRSIPRHARPTALPSSGAGLPTSSTQTTAARPPGRVGAATQRGTTRPRMSSQRQRTRTATRKHQFPTASRPRSHDLHMNPVTTWRHLPRPAWGTRDRRRRGMYPKQSARVAERSTQLDRKPEAQSGGNCLTRLLKGTGTAFNSKMARRSSPNSRHGWSSRLSSATAKAHARSEPTDVNDVTPPAQTVGRVPRRRERHDRAAARGLPSTKDITLRRDALRRCHFRQDEHGNDPVQRPRAAIEVGCVDCPHGREPGELTSPPPPAHLVERRRQSVRAEFVGGRGATSCATSRSPSAHERRRPSASLFEASRSARNRQNSRGKETVASTRATSCRTRWSSRGAGGASSRRPTP